MKPLNSIVQTGIIIWFTIFWNRQEVYSQNIGINKTNPSATLDVNGSLKANTLAINLGGNTSDFLVKSNVNGDVGYRKGHQAQAVRYLICVANGIYPAINNNVYEGYPFLGMIIMTSLPQDHFIPPGWLPCEGQLLPIGSYTALFSLILTTYGGDGVSTFALPDMRGTAPIGAGNGWTIGQRSN